MQQGMAMPLPFPQLYHGGHQQRGGGQNGLSTDMASVPLLTRMASSTAVEGLIQQVVSNFKSEPCSISTSMKASIEGFAPSGALHGLLHARQRWLPISTAA